MGHEMTDEYDEYSSVNTDKSEQFFRLLMMSQNRIHAFLFMMVHNESDAEDLLQETAAAMWQRFDDFQRDKSFITWGLAIAHNKAVNFIKRNAKTKVHLNDDIYRRIASIEMEDEKDNTERAEALRNCLKKMKETDQQLLLMRYENNIPTKKIAELFGRSQNGIYQTMARLHNLLYGCIRKTLALR
jgi:RNA polymerase sigma-70 factor (ECF subfamily)